MGQDLCYKCGEDSFEFRISKADWDLIRHIGRERPQEVELLFNVPELGQLIKVSTADLLMAADALDRWFNENPSAVPYTYQTKDEHEVIPGVPNQFSAGKMSGIRMQGDPPRIYYSLEAGLDKCVLKKYSLDHTEPLEVRDLRSEKELRTTTCGTITIRRTRARSELRSALRKIRSFLAAASDSTTTKIIE